MIQCTSASNQVSEQDSYRRCPAPSGAETVASRRPIIFCDAKKGAIAHPPVLNDHVRPENAFKRGTDCTDSTSRFRSSLSPVRLRLFCYLCPACWTRSLSLARFPSCSATSFRFLNFKMRLTKGARLPVAPLSLTKEVVGIHVLLTRSLFASDIPHRLLLRVSLAKSTSAPLRF
jgi:hypothetical protein